MSAKLIVLRGPSGSGKTTVARELQYVSQRDIVIVEQDYFRHDFLANKPDEKNIMPEMIYNNTMTALDAGYDVIVEGIFKKEKYKPMFERLMDAFDGEKYVYYFDIGFDETVRRHGTREKSAMFGAKDMKEWYFMAEPLGIDLEYHILETSGADDTIKLIQSRAGL